MNRDEAVLKIRSDPQWSSGVRDAYLEEDALAAAKRFHGSGEFAEIRRLLGDLLTGGRVLDLGAGTGISSYAFARAGAGKVHALEPDSSQIVGRGAMAPLLQDLPITPIEGVGEEIDLPDSSVDIVYCRAVLHHVRNLSRLMRECYRVLIPGTGRLLATREHVVDSEGQLRQFLERHPLNQLTHDENAYPLQDYLGAIQAAGFRLDRVLGPWDSVINAYPAVNSNAELQIFPATLLRSRFGLAGRLLGKAPPVRALVFRRLNRPVPGRLYSFLATRPLDQ